jgi:transcriptional regulator with XRE-family HTH domain
MIRNRYMPRIPAAPPIPQSPATWLANFRYRLMGENGERLSPEALGSRLGVSGATIRRWETGQSNPNEEDLGRLADVCRLSEQQGEFLLRLFARGTLRTPGAPKHFRDHARRFLAPQKCACLVDELLFIRAWTDDFAGHAGELATELAGGLNAVELSLSVGQRSEPELEALRVRALVRQMWMWTAQFAAFPAYTNPCGGCSNTTPSPPTGTPSSKKTAMT